jgi:hypothetical protein
MNVLGLISQLIIIETLRLTVININFTYVLIGYINVFICTVFVIYRGTDVARSWNTVVVCNLFVIWHTQCISLLDSVFIILLFL